MDSVIPTAKDILCGRGRRCFSHEGNIKFRQLIAESLQAYIDCPRRKLKIRLVQSLAEKVLETGARFLYCKTQFENDKMVELWFDGGMKKAKDKIGHTFRDALNEKSKCVENLHLSIVNDPLRPGQSSQKDSEKQAENIKPKRVRKSKSIKNRRLKIKVKSNARAKTNNTESRVDYDQRSTTKDSAKKVKSRQLVFPKIPTKTSNATTTNTNPAPESNPNLLEVGASLVSPDCSISSSPTTAFEDFEMDMSCLDDMYEDDALLLGEPTSDTKASFDEAMPNSTTSIPPKVRDFDEWYKAECSSLDDFAPIEEVSSQQSMNHTALHSCDPIDDEILPNMEVEALLRCYLGEWGDGPLLVVSKSDASVVSRSSSMLTSPDNDCQDGVYS